MEMLFPADETSGRRRRPADAVQLRLGRMRPGQTRGLRLRLLEIRDETVVPTPGHLQVQLTCDDPGGLFYATIDADLGDRPPAEALLAVMLDHHDATLPIPLVEDGKTVETGVALRIDEDVRWLLFWVTTTAGSGWPTRMVAPVRLRGAQDDRSADELETMRLPSPMTVLRGGITRALRRSASAPLGLLGDLMASDDPAEQAEIVESLLRVDSDLRWIETAARDVALRGEIGEGPHPVEIRIDRPAGAAFAVFRPGTPVHRINQILADALDHAFRPDDPDASIWRRIARSAVLVLHRRAPELLVEDLDSLREAGDPVRTEHLETLMLWAGRRRASVRETVEPSPDCLEIAGGEDPAAAERAAVEYLRWAGFLEISSETEG